MTSNVVAVVINWRDAARTVRCVRSLLPEQCVDEVVIVDNQSDGSLRVQVDLQFSGKRVSVIESFENLGFAGAVNLALKHPSITQRSFVLFINNDAIASPSALDVLATELERAPDTQMISPTILNVDGSIQAMGVKTNPWRARVREITELSEEPDYLTWACVMVRASLFDRIGGMDESFFMYWEDVEFGLRCKRAGGTIAVSRRSTVVHELSASRAIAGDRLRTYYAWGLMLLPSKLGGPWRLGAAVRAAEILAKRLWHGDMRGFMAIVRGLDLGIKRPFPAHAALAAAPGASAERQSL